MIAIEDKIASGIAARIREERARRRWSIADLAERSGVSKAMISAIEREAASPTAVLLVRLATAFGMTLSALIARAEGGGGGLMRRAEQAEWRDPETGYVRRLLSPPAGNGLELVRVSLPAGATVRFPAESYAFLRQQVWLIDGRLDFFEGDRVHRMEPGDCLALGAPADCAFHAPGPGPAEYLVALAREVRT